MGLETLLSPCRELIFGGEGSLGHSQGAVHMVAARLDCKTAMVGTTLANSHLGCIIELKKCYSHLVRGFIFGREDCLGPD